MRRTKREIKRLRALMRSATRNADRPAMQAEAIRMRDEGSSFREIARDLGVSYQTVFNWTHDRQVVREQPMTYLARLVS